MTSEQHTNVDGGINGNALSGDFHGPVQTGQNVVVNVQGIPEPPQSIREQIKDIWVTVSHDQLERIDRQKETDARFSEIRSEQQAAARDRGILLVLVVVCIVMNLFNLMLVNALWSRFEWVWQ